MEHLATLEARAAAIPSMGAHKIGNFLREAVRAAPSGSAIVEVGCWLGAGTAHIALGAQERSDDIEIHCFDQYVANESEAGKARDAGGLDIRPGQDTLPIVKGLLSPFGAPIRFHKGQLNEVEWAGGPIGVYVDDAAKTPQLWNRMVATFGPSWIPGQTLLILMDYLYWRKSGNEAHACQARFIERHAGCFEEIARPGGSCVVFRYVSALPPATN